MDPYRRWMEEAVETRNERLLFTAFREELKALTRGDTGCGDTGCFRETVSVKELIDLECLYAEAETRMYRPEREVLMQQLQELPR